MTDIGLKFLPNPGGEAEGLSDAGIETFRDKPFAAVAREMGQNSRDAKDNVSAPVRLTFDEIVIPSQDFPAIESYREVASLCLEKAKGSQSEKEIGFFEHALNVLNADEIRILRISDFNTRGVRGPCEENRPFHTLAKTDGISVKEDLDSGGSFGIGKNAVFALSDIQTAFFSTLYNDGDEQKVLCIGKTLFISHNDHSGQPCRRKGYWGKVDNFMPLDSKSDIPGWLLRAEQGTSIFSICMRSNPTDWRYEIAAAILINFFCAIERGEMEFEIDDGAIKINRNTLRGLFANADVQTAVKQLNAQAAFETAVILHNCLIDQQTLVKNLEVEGLGTVDVRILLRENLGYTIGIVRNGMYITDNLANFGEPFKRFPLHRDFAVLIEPGGPTEGQWFKRLENPRHDTLSAERITDPGLRKQGQAAFEKLAKMIRKEIRDLARTESSGAVDLDELSDFFASDEARVESEEGSETVPNVYELKPVITSPKRSKPRIQSQSGLDDDPPGPGPGPGPIPPEPGPVPPGPGPHVRPRTVLQPVRLDNVRAIMPDDDQPTARRLIFTPGETGEIVVYAAATGLSSPEQLDIVASSSGKIAEGGAAIVCHEGARVSIDVKFGTEYAGAIEVSGFKAETEAEQAA